MPREAPVTRAALPSNRIDTPLRYQRFGRRQVAGRAKRGDFDVRQRSSHQAGEHLAGADLEEAIAAKPRQAPKRFGPADWRVDLHLELVAKRPRILRDLCADVQHDRNPRGTEARRGNGAGLDSDALT